MCWANVFFLGRLRKRNRSLELHRQVRGEANPTWYQVSHETAGDAQYEFGGLFYLVSS